MASSLLLACIISAFTVSLCDWQHPHYSFRCLEDGGVEFYGVHNSSIIYLTPSSTVAPNDNGVVKINADSLSPVQEGKYIKINVYDPMFDFSTTTNKNPYEGGHNVHTFIITCKEIPVNGVSKSVARVFEEKNSNKLPENYKEVDDVVMRFKAVKDKDAPDISSIYVGDEFYMFIEYKGDADYTLVPRNCEAIRGTMVPKDHNLTDQKNFVELWKSLGAGNCVQHPELLASFQRVTGSNKVVYAKMYGFRFTDNSYITITCDVRMYPASASKNNTCETSNRRKRSIQRNTHHVLKRMQVFDSKDIYQSENNSQCNHCGFSVWIVAFITTTLFQRWL